jgi:hypothetical protein
MVVRRGLVVVAWLRWRVVRRRRIVRSMVEEEEDVRYGYKDLERRIEEIEDIE